AQYVVGDRCDLHGLTAADACARVRRFIDSSRHARHRCVCIVHGRGLHSEQNLSVLRTRVRESLRSHRSVLAYADAPPGDGAAGTIGGRVIDATGLSMPGVTVTVQGVDLTQAFVTDGDGRFRFLDLAPGRYSVTSTLEGFATNVRENVVLDLGKHVDLPVTMQ